MDKKTKLIIGGIAVAFMAYVLFRKPKTSPAPTPNPTPVTPDPIITDPILNPIPVDTLPPTSEEDFNKMEVAYGDTKESACLSRSIPTVTLYFKESGISPNKTIFYTDSSHTTPIKSGYYAEKFDLCFYVGDGGLLTEMTTC